MDPIEESHAYRRSGAPAMTVERAQRIMQAQPYEVRLAAGVLTREATLRHGEQAYGLGVQAALQAGPLCRGVPCRCPEGRGHNHPAWQAYEAEERAREEADDE